MKTMISVIIPTYNREKLLKRAIESVLQQSWRDLEVIVVDDCSTDHTQQMVASIRDERVIYHCLDHNSGACAARNVGIDLAKGNYIAFQDSDDEWFPNKLEEQMKQLEQSNADVVFCSFDRIGTDGRLIHTFPFPETLPGKISYHQLMMGNLISTQTILGRKECFAEEKFDERFPRLQDWEIMLRITRRFDVRYYNTPLVRIYEQPDSISKQSKKMVQALDMLYEIHRPLLEREKSLGLNFRCMRYKAAAECGANVANCYLREISLRNTMRVNCRLLKFSFRSRFCKKQDKDVEREERQ